MINNIENSVVSDAAIAADTTVEGVTAPAEESTVQNKVEHVVHLSQPDTWEEWMHVFVVRDCAAASRAAAHAKLCAELEARGVSYVD